MSEKKPMETATPRSIEEQRLMASTCCYCIPLKIACFTLGYLSLLINIFNTLIIVSVFVFLGVMTQGFSNIHMRMTESGQVDDIDPVEQSEMYYVLLGTGFVLLMNFSWLCWNVCLLVGLHKKRPGPIKLHVTIASIRFVLLVIALVALPGPGNGIEYIVMECTEISLIGYFIIVYHAYATRLERSLKARTLTIDATTPPEISITDVYFAYPKVLDKQHLVEKEKY